jgi:hypothetical protein
MAVTVAAAASCSKEDCKKTLAITIILTVTKKN